MPVIIDDYINPSSEWVPYVLEDIYLKGGFRVFNTLQARDDYTNHAKSIAWFEDYDSRKPGMLCHVIETGKLYQLDSTRDNWEEFNVGAEFDVDAPLKFEDGKLTLDTSKLLPTGGTAGDVLTKAVNGTAIWQTLPDRAGLRRTIEHTAVGFIQPGQRYDFDFDTAATIMMLVVEVNTPEVTLEGWTTPARDDENPYTFISDDIRMIDQGVRDQNGTITKFRRFSFMSNLEDPVQERQYFSMTNNNPFPVQPTVKITFLALQ